MSDDDYAIGADIVSLEGMMENDELKPATFTKVAALQALQASLLDSMKYIIAVSNLEATLVAKLDEKYYSAITAKWLDIKKQGDVYATGEQGQLELARCKFSELMRLIDRKIVHEEVLKL